MHTALVLSRLESLTGWWFVGASACVFAAVAAAVHGALALVDRVRRRPPRWAAAASRLTRRWMQPSSSWRRSAASRRLGDAFVAADAW